MLSAYCIGNSAGPFMWQAQYRPRYALAFFNCGLKLMHTQQSRPLDCHWNLLRLLHVSSFDYQMAVEP